MDVDAQLHTVRSPDRLRARSSIACRLLEHFSGLTPAWRTILPTCSFTVRVACRFLEDELARRYREAAPHVLAVLQDRVEAASRELLKSDSELRAAEDVSAVRATGERVGGEARVRAATEPRPMAAVGLGDARGVARAVRVMSGLGLGLLTKFQKSSGCGGLKNGPTRCGCPLPQPCATRPTCRRASRAC